MIGEIFAYLAGRSSGRAQERQQDSGDPRDITMRDIRTAWALIGLFVVCGVVLLIFA